MPRDDPRGDGGAEPVAGDEAAPEVLRVVEVRAAVARHPSAYKYASNALRTDDPALLLVAAESASRQARRR